MQVIFKRFPERGLLQLLEDLRVSLRAGAAFASRFLILTLVVLLGPLRLERWRPGPGGQLQPWGKAEQGSRPHPVPALLPTYTHTQSKGDLLKVAGHMDRAQCRDPDNRRCPSACSRTLSDPTAPQGWRRKVTVRVPALGELNIPANEVHGSGRNIQ